jgi:hypothetical protein
VTSSSRRSVDDGRGRRCDVRADAATTATSRDDELARPALNGTDTRRGFSYGNDRWRSISTRSPGLTLFQIERRRNQRAHMRRVKVRRYDTFRYIFSVRERLKATLKIASRHSDFPVSRSYLPRLLLAKTDFYLRRKRSRSAICYVTSRGNTDAKQIKFQFRDTILIDLRQPTCDFLISDLGYLRDKREKLQSTLVKGEAIRIGTRVHK